MGSRIVNRIVVGCISFAFGAVLWALDTPPAVLARLLAALLLGLALLYFSRFLTHIELDYWHPQGQRRRFMRLWLVLEAVIAIVFAVAGPALVLGPLAAPAINLAEFGAASTLLLVVLIHSLVLSWLIADLDLPRGSEHAAYCRAVRGLVWLADRLNLNRLADWCLTRTRATTLSAMALTILAGLGSVAVANIPAVLDSPDVARFLNRSSPENGDNGGPRRDGNTSDAPSPSGVAQVDSSLRSPDSANIQTVDATATTPSAAGTTPDFEHLCGVSLPFDTAPEPQRTQLSSAWLYSEVALGAIFAGCPSPGHPVGPVEGVWFAAGTCLGELRSLAVAVPGAEVAILLWRPARFALARAQDGSLVGATSQVKAGNGDVYTVTTAEGTYVFARRILSDGTGGLEGEPQSCADVQEDPVPFVEVPPALTRLWLGQVLAEGLWIWPAAEVDGRVVFHSDDPADERTIVGRCRSSIECTLRVDGSRSSAAGAGAIDTARLLDLAPAISG